LHDAGEQANLVRGIENIIRAEAHNADALFREPRRTVRIIALPVSVGRPSTSMQSFAAGQ
jgi:hypothetical protein